MGNRNYRGRRNNRGRARRDDIQKEYDKKKGTPEEPTLDKRSNDPNWYYLDAKLAEETSQLSFQQLAGRPITIDGYDFGVPNVVTIALNACPGVIDSADYNTSRMNKYGINLAAFRLYSKLAMFSGRVQTYAPQDVATMILGIGSVLESFETIRRMFGVAYTMNMRNRSYPEAVLEEGMLVDANDLYTNYSIYKTQFNKLVTLFNQIPIMDDIAYLKKCQQMYEAIYLDADSPMAQTIVPMPFTVWELDEISYSGGSILKTVPFASNAAMTSMNTTPQLMSYYLSILENQIVALLTSSTMTIIYTDIMHLSDKLGGSFTKLDYLYNDYAVAPKYDTNFLLQFHNATINGAPTVAAFQTSPAITPYNDVYPEPNSNSLYYNPGFNTVANVSGGLARTGNTILVDMLTPSPSVTDRVEVTRLMSCGMGQPVVIGTQNLYIDTVLPDHYVVNIKFQDMVNDHPFHVVTASILPPSAFLDTITLANVIDWFPHIYEIDANNAITGKYCGDLNYYTTLDRNYLKKLNDFITLALFDAR